MKKSLLFVFALGAACFANAQTYSGTTQEDEGYAASYDGAISLNAVITIEQSAENELLIKGWMGAEGYDLKVTYDADENVTSVTSIENGEEGTPVKSGYAGANTGSSAYYYVNLYLGEGYDYAGVEDGEGYVFLSGYFYKAESEYVWNYYYLTFEEDHSSVKVVTASDDALEFYNLQGVRVDKPANGLYIARCGNKAFKTFVR